MTAGVRTLPGSSASSSQRMSVPTHGKLEGISATPTYHPEPESNFPRGVTGCTAQSDPAEAARSRTPQIPGRGRQRPITERLGRERQEGARS